MSDYIERMIEKSTCFGLAWDGNVRECKICEVNHRCASKCTMGRAVVPEEDLPAKPTIEDIVKNDIPFEMVEETEPTEAEEAEEAEETEQEEPKQEETSKVEEQNETMPDFRNMSLDDLEQLYAKRGLDLKDMEKYVNPSIRKMRMTMAIKKTYQE